MLAALAQAADPDLALAGLAQVAARDPGLIGALAADPAFRVPADRRPRRQQGPGRPPRPATRRTPPCCAVPRRAAAPTRRRSARSCSAPWRPIRPTRSRGPGSWPASRTARGPRRRATAARPAPPPRRPPPAPPPVARHRPGGTARRRLPPPAAAPGRARRDRRRHRGRGRRGAGRPRRRGARGRARGRPRRAAAGRRAGPVRGRGDGQVRGPRAQLRQRHRRDLRRRAAPAGSGRTASDGAEPGDGAGRRGGRAQDGDEAGRRPDPGLRADHAGRLAVPGRPEPAPRGPPGAAGAHPGQPPRLLRPLGEDLGVPGPAQGAPGGGRPGPRPAVRRTRSRRWCGRPPSGRTSSRTCRRCAAGSSTRCPRTWRAASSSSARAACATSSSPSSCCSWCTAGPTTRLRVAATLPALAALAEGGYVGRADAEDLGAGVPLPAPDRAPAPAVPAAPHPHAARPIRRCCAASAGRSAQARAPCCRTCAWFPPASARPIRRRAARGRPGARGRRPAGAGVHRGVDQDRPAGPPPAREAVLPAAARRGGEAAVGCGPADPGGGPGPAGGARLPRPGGCAAAYRGADVGAAPPGGDPADAAAGAARLVRRRGRAGRRPARVPSGQRGAGGFARGSCGCCGTRPRRPSGWPACWPPAGTRPACCCAPRRRSRCSPTTPSWCRRPVDALRAEMMAAARRHDGDAEQAAVAVRSLRRRELFRVAAANVLEPDRPGRDGRGADRDHHRRAGRGARRRRSPRSRRSCATPLPTRFAVIAMGRYGGHESGFGSDADVIFVHDPPPGLDPAAERRASDAAQAVGAELRRLLQIPAPDPPLLVDADLRPEGKAGAAGPLARRLRRVLRPPGRRRGSRRRCCGPSSRCGDAELGARFIALADRYRYPDGGLERRRGARDPADQGAGRGRAHPAADRPRPAPQARPRRPVRRGVDRPAAAAAARLRACPACAPPGPWRPWTRPSAAGLVAGRRRGRAARLLAFRGPDQERDHAGPRPARRHAAGPARRADRGRPAVRLQAVRGDPPRRDGASSWSDTPAAALEEDYRRTARRARKVMDRLFYG